MQDAIATDAESKTSWQASSELIRDLEEQLLKQFKFESNNSQNDRPDYCIFLIPGKIFTENPLAYQPRNFIIGPLVRRRHSFTEYYKEEKCRYAESFLSRGGGNGVSWSDFIELIGGSLAKILGCFEQLCFRSYDDSSQRTRQNKRASADEFNPSMIIDILIDAGFIIELLYKAYTKKPKEGNDRIFGKAGMVNDVKRDLMLLSNQLPLFLLRKMYERSFGDKPVSPSFLQLIFHFFSHYYSHRIPIDMCESELEDWKHFTDLIRTLQRPCWLFKKKNQHQCAPCACTESEPASAAKEEMVEQSEYLYSAVLLREAGVKFKVRLKSTCLFNIEFEEKSGELKIPPLKVDYSTESFYGNLMVWEQCYYPNDTFICDYIYLMGYLIKSSEDVNIFFEKEF